MSFLILALLFVLSVPSAEATFCTDLEAIQTKVLTGDWLDGLTVPPQGDAPANRSAYEAWLAEVYGWHPTDAELEEIANRIVEEFDKIKAHFTETGYLEGARECLATAKTEATTAYQGALTTLNTQLEQTLTVLKATQQKVQDYVDKINEDLANCDQVAAFTTQILLFSASWSQYAADLAAFAFSLLRDYAEAYLEALDAAIALVATPEDASDEEKRTALVEALKQILAFKTSLARGEALIREINAKIEADKAALQTKLQELRDKVHSFQERLNALREHFQNGVKTTLPADLKAVFATNYGQVSATFYVDADTVYVTVTATGNNGFSITLEATVYGDGDIEVKRSHLFALLRRWAIFEWGFQCRDTAEDQTRRRAIAATENTQQVGQVLTATLYGTDQGTGISSCVASLVLVLLAFLLI